MKENYTPAQIAEAEEKREKYKEGIKEAEKYRIIIDEAINLLSRFPHDKKMEEIRGTWNYNGMTCSNSPRYQLELIFGSNEGAITLEEKSEIGSKRYPKENDDMTIGEIIDSLKKQRETLASDEPYEIK